MTNVPDIPDLYGWGNSVFNLSGVYRELRNAWAASYSYPSLGTQIF